MKAITVGISLLSLALASCGSSSEAPAPKGSASADAKMAMNGPFARAEASMNDAMMAAVGTSIGDTWVRKMIAHHRGAVEMSKIVLGQKPTADVARMARDTVTKQTAEIADLEKLVAQGASDPATAEPYRAAETKMHEAMMAATGADLSETYLRKMLEHHKGAVAMSEIALAGGVTGPIRARAEKVRGDQQKEIGMVEAMLRGSPMPSAQPSPAASAARPAASPSRAAPVASTALKAPVAKAATPRPAPTPSASDLHAGHDMKTMKM